MPLRRIVEQSGAEELRNRREANEQAEIRKEIAKALASKYRISAI